MARSSVRRHLVNHMSVDASTATAMGLDPVSIVLRIQVVAERAREVAEEALDAGNGIVAVRAGDAELRALAALSSMGVEHEGALQKLDSYAAVTHAVIRAARRNPEVGEAIAAQLDVVDRRGFARDIREQFQESRGISA